MNKLPIFIYDMSLNNFNIKYFEPYRVQEKSAGALRYLPMTIIREVNNFRWLSKERSDMIFNSLGVKKELIKEFEYNSENIKRKIVVDAEREWKKRMEESSKGSYRLLIYDHGGVANKLVREERRNFLDDASKRAEELLNHHNIYKYVEIWKGSKTMWMCHKDSGSFYIEKREFK